jgi:thymidylate synthase
LAQILSPQILFPIELTRWLMELKLVVEAKNVKPINPMGTVAICSLWTPPGYLFNQWEKAVPGSLSGDTPVALVGGLYGGGLDVMLRNLHHNPQIDTVIINGKDFSGSGQTLINFFKGLVEKTGRFQSYRFEDGRVEKIEKQLVRGPGADYGMDSLITPDNFKVKPKFLDWNSKLSSDLKLEIESFLKSYCPSAAPDTRPEPIALPRPLIKTFPSDTFSQVITARTICEGWGELLFRLSRFGRPVTFRNGKERLELNNLKAVITDPSEIAPDDYKLLNLSKDELNNYQNELLKKSLEHGLPYTYGHRMRSYFNQDLLLEAARDLAIAGDSRHALICLWDNLTDRPRGDAPCLSLVFFRKIEDKVHLSAVFRSHNGARAWPVNLVGLYGLMKFVCEKANLHAQRTEPNHLRPGTLTVTSLSISLDPADMAQVESIIERRAQKNRKTNLDPNGHFEITIDRNKGQIVVFHRSMEGEILAEHRAKTAEEMSWLLERSLSISNIGHALYLGGQLERAWRCLVNNQEYVQDKSIPKN